MQSVIIFELRALNDLSFSFALSLFGSQGTGLFHFSCLHTWRLPLWPWPSNNRLFRLCLLLAHYAYSILLSWESESKALITDPFYCTLKFLPQTTFVIAKITSNRSLISYLINLLQLLFSALQIVQMFIIIFSLIWGA